MKIKNSLGDLHPKSYRNDLGILPEWFKDCKSDNPGQVKNTSKDFSTHSPLYRLPGILAIVFAPILGVQRTQNV